ncbi:MAG: imidazolonepropionase [Acidimicrobiales bacterium]|nr:imidazolonepropionase [Acidimicrobiales bacterium]
MWDLLITGTAGGGAIGIAGDRIAWAGSEQALPPAAATARHRWPVHGRLVTPGLVDCHTHLVFAGDRSSEWERRLAGARYDEIAAAGGGINATVAATRAASDADLLAGAVRRAAALAAGGVTTIEVKSGYGLDLDTEVRMLRVARRIAEHVPVTVVTTFLGAHTVPPEFGTGDDYVSFVCDEVLPAVAAEGLADAVDAFAEHVAFTPAQVDRVLTAATALGLPVKLHADQLSDGGGAALAARHGALSADHLERSSPDGVAALAAAGTVAVLLPGAGYVLGDTATPPVAALRRAGVPMAVATDCNPGTSPLVSLPLAMHMACTRMGLTVAEALAGATEHAARALGLSGVAGVIAPGARADLVVWDADDPAQIVYWIGLPPVHTVVQGGRFVTGA